MGRIRNLPEHLGSDWRSDQLEEDAGVAVTAWELEGLSLVYRLPGGAQQVERMVLAKSRMWNGFLESTGSWGSQRGNCSFLRRLQPSAHFPLGNPRALMIGGGQRTVEAVPLTWDLDYLLPSLSAPAGSPGTCSGRRVRQGSEIGVPLTQGLQGTGLSRSQA